MTIWKESHGKKHFAEICKHPWRVVESQSILTSRNLVDTKEEYEILEEMLESSKPSADKATHYLIFTPFRYPPLKYGSRFGSKYEPSLWYGSLEIETSLSEIAYYRLLFICHSSANLGFINTSLTAFQSLIKTKNGLDLCARPFAKYKDQISCRNNYEYSQRLGTDMREAGIEAFIYWSARSLNKGKNIASFTPKIFFKKNGSYTFNFQTWQCIASKKSVEFIDQHKKKVNFIFENFSNDGELDTNPEWVEFN